MLSLPRFKSIFLLKYRKSDRNAWIGAGVSGGVYVYVLGEIHRSGF